MRSRSRRWIRYQTRTAPDVRINDSLAKVEGYVTQAEQNGGGWVQLVFHDLCSTGCAGDDYSTTPALFTRCSTGCSHGRPTAPW